MTSPERLPRTHVAPSAGLFAAGGPFGELGQAELVRLSPNSWAVTGPLGEVGEVLNEARRYGKVIADAAQPMPGGVVLVNFRVIRRTPAPAVRPEAQPAHATRPAAERPVRRALSASTTAPAPRRRTVPRWVWGAAGTTAAGILVAVCGLAVWVGAWVADNIAAILTAVFVCLLGLAALLGLAGGGRSGTWKTD